LPEGVESRILEAYGFLNKEEIARIILLGDKAKILSKARELHLLIHEEDIINPQTSERLPEFIDTYYQLRKEKGLGLEEAEKSMRQAPLYFGAMMVRKGLADGMVGGCVNPTAEVLRSSLRIIGLKPGITVCSSFIIISLPYGEYGHAGILLYADIGVVPFPDENALADIAISTAQSFRTLFREEPRVAMLSFSSHGSARHPLLKKIIEAAAIARKKSPGLLIDGELQADAALVPEVARLKVGESPVAGKANVLIFPDLNSGNISYKLTQRLARAEAYGPFIQGLSRPVSDLSRGATVSDIVATVAVVAASTSAY
jgi:phosphate acetyltransferase